MCPASHQGLQRSRSPRLSTARVLQWVLLLVVLLCSFSLMAAVVTAPCGDGAHRAICVSALSGAVLGRGKGLHAPPLTVSLLQPVALPPHTGSAVVVAAARADGDVDDTDTFSKVGDLFAVEESASASVPSPSSTGVRQGANGRGSTAAKAPGTTASSPSLSVEPLSRGSSAAPSLRWSLSLSSAADSAVVLVGEDDADTGPPPSSPAPPPDDLGTRRPPATRLALLGLIALVVPAAIIALVVWCVCRRTRYKRKVKGLRLNGTRQPGEVDDVDMGNVVRGGDWLNLDAATPGRTKIGASRTRFSILVPSTAAGARMDATFDPIGQQAAETRQRKRARRAAVAAAVAAVVPANDAGDGGSDGVASPLRGDLGAGGSDVWSSDEEEHSNGYSVNGGVSGGNVGVADGSAQGHATSSVLPGTGATGAGASSGAGPHLSGGAVASSVATAVSPQDHDLHYFNETARLLLGRYTAESGGGVPQMPPSTLPGGGGAATQSLRLSSGNEVESSKTVVNKPKSAFEQILSFAVAPLQVGPEFHQRGDTTDSGNVADSAGGPRAVAAPVPRDRERAERHTEKEEMEEEHAFQGDEELDEEYKGEVYGD
ncbi:3'a2rel-related protein [Leishmania mexicana MHOM/GT/2001/U1103]|uniref:3'a2rel-related protein n=1 Tax=Leishmania mexicana (strain MHOM/GT/2001/U1103) TaxID=929439 RepID=E9AVQ1_LEIMU|nr:3'a2rel-related protein [Leishmania mexicana MHOM/GT/2001/U1103]XP_003875539.1 3'a2rel-related protein [Leishmania mexicana MHOM/GT/2001/U1103]CBZ27034.1 3'a2rel-related protein [Leishmania mexicana MHOM/GT/2001/U1103]CBZ27050.1 3'a2rel-related protein [Leishmania mexicana MHOM/GT/2001/U1103]